MKIILGGRTPISEVLNKLSEFKSENGSAVLIGCKPALSKIRPDDISEIEKKSFLSKGYLAKYESYDCISIPNHFKIDKYHSIFNSTDFLIATEEAGLEISKCFNE